MLRSLQVRNYVLIDSLEIEFPAGLVIITGQTGAGKSILLGAVSLLMGAKADASVVGVSGDNCVVEGEFDCSEDESLKSLFEEADLEWNGGLIVVRRVVSRSGRSRSFVGDEPVTRDTLSAIALRLIDIHSQHENLILADEGFRLGVLDVYAGNGELLKSTAAAWKELSATQKTLKDVEETLARLYQEQDFNSSALRQLQEASLKEGELEMLEQQQKMLAGAEEIRENLMQVSALYDGDESARGVSSALKESVRLVGKLSRYIPEASELGERLESARAELNDVFSSLSSLGADIDNPEGQLEAVEQRMSKLYDLMSRHNVRSVEELIAIREKLSGEAGDMSSLEDEKISLSKKVEELSAKVGDLSDKLHRSREMAASSFAAKITESLHGLSLERAAFGAELRTAPQGASGYDRVDFTFSAAGGSNLLDVKKVSSGGEMSRIMLAIKDLMARFTAMPTMIFDEIDTGISGSVADNVGSMICRMGEDMQVLTITHLPQVAAKGKAHLLVSKDIAPDGKAITKIRKIEGEERVMEIARMLSGATVTKEAMANAKSLLQSSQSNTRLV